MKKIVKIIFVLLLVVFSFFYTDKIMKVVNKKDPLMVTLKEKIDDYKVESVNAIITDTTIIPGIKGKEVDLDKSYEKMKLEGVFREESIVFKDIYPEDTLSSNKNKYIIRGNPSKNEVSLLYIVDSRSDLEKVRKLKNISLFVNTNYLSIEITNELRNNEIYSYGNNGVYSEDNIRKSTNIINRLANNKIIYCLVRKEDDNVLNICQKAGMSTIIPTIQGDYLEVKKNLSPGSIILLSSLNNYDIIIRYINSKGYQIIGLSELLKE